MSLRVVSGDGISRNTAVAAILSAVARRLREEVSGGTHHAIAKGNAGAAIVADDHDRDVFIRRVGETIKRHEWSCLAYCLLDTHVHLILGTPHPNLGAGMKSLLGPYAQNFNWRHEREGHLFRARFYSRRNPESEPLDRSDQLCRPESRARRRRQATRAVALEQLRGDDRPSRSPEFPRCRGPSSSSSMRIRQRRGFDSNSASGTRWLRIGRTAGT